jgi:hypothetical protein
MHWRLILLMHWSDLQLSTEFWTDLTEAERQQLHASGSMRLALADAEVEITRRVLHTPPLHSSNSIVHQSMMITALKACIARFGMQSNDNCSCRHCLQTLACWSAPLHADSYRNTLRDAMMQIEAASGAASSQVGCALPEWSEAHSEVDKHRFECSPG